MSGTLAKPTHTVTLHRMINRKFGTGFHTVFAKGQLTLGIGYPLEAYSSPIPLMKNQLSLGQKVEDGGFAAVWVRDVPLLDPSFGDAGQIYDTWSWMGYLAAQTTSIALCTGSVILPLRHPVDAAKAAASVDHLSAGRVILGVASGDRPVEYSVYDVPFDTRDAAFRDAIGFIRNNTHRPDNWDDQQALRSGQVELLPKSYHGDLPLLVTGNSRQSLDWIAANADGWLMYPRPPEIQQTVVEEWQQNVTAAGVEWKPFSQSLYIDLTEDADTSPTKIHLGYRLGRNRLIEHLGRLRDIGVNHVALNIRFASRPVADVIDELCEYVVPEFPKLQT